MAEDEKSIPSPRDFMRLPEPLTEEELDKVADRCRVRLADGTGDFDGPDDEHVLRLVAEVLRLRRENDRLHNALYDQDMALAEAREPKDSC